jgi:heterodisulfide reductase subunit C
MHDGHYRAGTLPAAEAQLRKTFLAEAALVPGADRVSRCLQCGSCTASCPVSYAMDIPPRQVIALFRAGLMAEILKSRTIWICASCYMCTTRCPQSIKITDLLYALKRTAMQARLYPERFPVYRLSRAFVANLRRFGRNHEPLLLLRYHLKHSPWALLGLARLGWAMLRRGRVALWPRRIKGGRAIQAMLAAASTLEVPHEKDAPEYGSEMVGYRAVG